MTIERPMFPPRAESVDSFSPQPGIGQPESQTLTSESPKSSWGNVLAFPSEQRPRPRDCRRSSGVNIRTLIFRSYDLIVESDEAELARDVCRDIHKAEVKLRKVKQRLRGVQEQSAAQIQLLTAAETKLSAAIEAIVRQKAVLS
jgi:hypothetical protein